MELSAFGLKRAPWARREGLDRLVAALGEGASRVVGGAVRDAVLGIDAADLDLATVHPPDEAISRLKAAGIRVVPTGLAHGTVTAVLESGPVEVTALRRDLSTDGRHAVVAFTDDWQADAARRDFTINALYADPISGVLHDWFGGLDDLAARRVRFIGDPLRRIAEDHLRILRFFRFHARFGDAVDADGLAACAARANDLMALSRERIAAELLKLLVAPGAGSAMALMIERGIWRPVLPEIAVVEPLIVLADREAAAGVAPDAIRRLAALVPAPAAAAVGARLKLSNADRRRLEGASGPLGDEGPAALAYRIGVQGAIDRLLLHGQNVAPLAGWSPRKLPIGGGALVARGLRRGPDVAATLARIETRWVREGFPEAARVDAIADEEVAAAL